MTAEQIQYRLQPTGFGSPETQRKYEKPDSRLASMFEEWLTKIGPSFSEPHDIFVEDKKRLFVSTEMCLKLLDITIEQAHGLIYEYQDHPLIAHAGVFLSAAYNTNKEKLIVYDISSPSLHFVASYLPADKIFINFGILGDACGGKSQGLAINLNRADRLFGIYNEGVLINYGEARDRMGYGQDDSGLFINCGKLTKQYGALIDGRIIDLGKVKESGDLSGRRRIKPKNPDEVSVLKKYFDYMKQRLLARDFEGLGKEQIEKDIEKIIKTEGYKWIK